MDHPDHRIPPSPSTGRPEGEPDAEPALPGFPVYLLAAPGFILTLVAAMADVLVKSTKSTGLALAIGAVACAGAVACFGVIAAKSKERHIHVGIAIMIGATIFAFCGAVLRLH